ncbi:flagellar hook-basal body complex protein FliE [Roseomonas sp. NAR14]|uniref:Flagellar hook-basal body complex protein FliE n=1 Tax=Roseomonas acroporae TaxID=2937791 RepID=A0A9X1Y3S8_9PROT|nr:flagellar hook-basal body complex protein FliE [Roseomonas acroporae]MCK8782768.1 flagellar hook-basal body complex protein FliE [Roseomonas acroporae]
MTAPVLAPAGAAAYRATQAIGAGTEASSSSGGFGAVLQRAVEGAIDVGHAADTASTRALVGQGSVNDVVVAVSRAELALQTAVAVRDRVVSAYQEIMRMPI